MERIILFASLMLTFTACSDDSSSLGGITDPSGLSQVQTFARATPYSKLVIELDSIEGFEPSNIDAKMVEHLTPLVDKPGGIQIVRDQTIAARGEDHLWSFDEVKTLFAEHKTLELAGDQTRIHVIFVDGGYEDDTASGKTLGLAWSTNVVMFQQSILNACSKPLLSTQLCPLAEQAILLHEFGHVLGLVNNGAPLTAGHQDTEHGRHCSNPDCIMYWEYEGAKVFEILQEKLLANDDKFLTLDADCKADLAAIE